MRSRSVWRWTHLRTAARSLASSSLTRRELDEAQLLRASVDAKLEAETGAGAALREELAAMRRENEAMRLGFAARLEEMTASQGRLRAQQDELGRLARDG